MATAQFMPITGSAINLQDLIPVGKSSGDMTDKVAIQLIDSLGRMTQTYTWINWAGDDGTTEAWVDGGYNIVENVTFAPGQGLWVSAIDGVSLQSSGVVGKSDVVVSLQKDFTATGNPFPTPVNIQDILPQGKSPADMTDKIAIQLLDDLGRMTQTYTWINWAGDDGTTEAWVDGGYGIVEGVSFEPGFGLWVSAIDGVSLRFPAPEL